jgi:putative PIG3 family NAD(P)H quinone oxidoreductase
VGWEVGQQACALLAGGGYAQKVAVPASQLLPVPAGVDLVTAATLPEAACTVWSNLVMEAGLTAGQVLLVHGGASGIGTMAIQVGRALGARVAVTAGSQRKLRRCAELGAEVLVSYREDDFVTVVRERTGGADVVLDVVGGPYLGRNLDVLAPDGTLVVIGLQGGTRAELDLGRLLAKRARVVGTTLRARPVEQKARIVAEVVTHVWPMLERGLVRPVVDRVLPLPEVSQAHRALEAGEHVGKIALVVP